jgi:hypothetical protein
MITDTNILTSPSGEILGYAISFNLTNELITSKEKLNELLQAYRDVHPFYNRGYKGSIAIMGRIGLILDAVYKTLTLDELEVLIKNEPYPMLMDRMLNEIHRHRPCERGYRIYAEYYPKSCDPDMAKWKVKRNVRHFREYVDKMEGWNKTVNATGGNKKMAKANYVAQIKEVNTKLNAMKPTTPKMLNEYVEIIRKTDTLESQNPYGYFNSYNYIKRIADEAVPECKEAYWNMLHEKPKEKETDTDRLLANAAGIAFGKIMTESDLENAFDYVNKQRSWKLIELIMNKKEPPPMARKAGSIGILSGITEPPRTNMLVYFIKRYKDMKDPDLRRGLLEMAPEFGLTNYPKPFYQ